MEQLRYLKPKIIFLIIVTAIGYVFFSSQGTAIARNNAYLACFVDDTSCMFKTQVIYSGAEIEGQRLAIFTDAQTKDSDSDDSDGGVSESVSEDADDRLLVSSKTDKTRLLNSSGQVESEGTIIDDKTQYETFFSIEKGTPYLAISENEGGTTGNDTSSIEPREVRWGNVDCSNSVSPLTFPAISQSDFDASNADINRAYEVQDAIASDFTDALLFINGGENYTSLSTLFETAYYLVNASADGTTSITNKAGNVYRVSFIKDGSKTTKKIRIYETTANGGSGKAQIFTFGVIKGYLGCTLRQEMENGTFNNVTSETIRSAVKNTDTTWVTWEHLYYEGVILYAEGITYSNQADLYSADELEKGLVKVTRSLLTGLKSMLQLYSMEDMIFNTGIRGSKAFVYGAYYDNWSDSMSILFLVFTSIALSLVMISLIVLIIKKQAMSMSPQNRVSILMGLQNTIVALFLLASIWWIIKLALLLNYRFVNIWSTYIGDNTLENFGGSYSVLSSILFQFAYFILDVYINFVYILRGLFIAALIVTAPIFLILFSFGGKFANITGTWAKELVGYIFMQSIHAFVYGFIIMASGGLRGIENLVVCCSIIPLTNVYKEMFGLSFDNITQTAKGLTNNTTNTIGSAVSTGAQMVSSTTSALSKSAGNLGSAMGGAGGAMGGTGGAMGGAISKIAGATGGLVKMGAGGFNVGLGIGQELVTGDGSSVKSQGFRDFAQGYDQLVNSGGGSGGGGGVSPQQTSGGGGSAGAKASPRGGSGGGGYRSASVSGGGSGEGTGGGTGSGNGMNYRRSNNNSGPVGGGTGRGGSNGGDYKSASASGGDTGSNTGVNYRRSNNSSGGVQANSTTTTEKTKTTSILGANGKVISNVSVDNTGNGLPKKEPRTSILLRDKEGKPTGTREVLLKDSQGNPTGTVQVPIRRKDNRSDTQVKPATTQKFKDFQKGL
jgi:hypothetical protein